MRQGRRDAAGPSSAGGENRASRTLRLVAIQNMAGGGFPRFERHLSRGRQRLRVVHVHRGEALPSPEECDAIFVGGSPLSAYEWQEHRRLRDEAAFLRRAVEEFVPVLGVCFGAQFLAHLLGGRAYRAARPEVGAGTIRLTEEGRCDPLLAGWPPALEVVHWHADTFDLPPGATLLARGDAVRHQMFRRDHVVGVQFHPEVTETEVAAWADAHPRDLATAGTTKQRVVAECRAMEAGMDRLAARLLDNFLAVLVRDRT